MTIGPPRRKALLINAIPSLSDLEPVATAGLAICLSYLALERFRYRQAIEQQALRHYEKYENDEKLKAQQKLDPLNELRWLCRKECNGHVPPGALAAIYRRVFRSQMDVIVIGILAGFCGFSLITGAAHGIELAHFGRWPTWWPLVELLFYLCVIAMIAPVIAIFSGRKCVKWGTSRAKHQEEQIATSLRLNAVDARLPDDPPSAAVESVAAARAAVRLDELARATSRRRPGMFGVDPKRR